MGAHGCACRSRCRMARFVIVLKRDWREASTSAIRSGSLRARQNQSVNMASGLLGILTTGVRVVAAAERSAARDAQRRYAFQQRILRDQARRQAQLERAQRHELQRSIRNARQIERELQRQARERAKLNELEQARLTVEMFENRCEVLTSVHKEPLQEVDWYEVATLLAPLPPRRRDEREFQFRVENRLVFATEDFSGLTPEQRDSLKVAQEMDDRSYEAELVQHRADAEGIAAWSKLAHRVLDGEPEAYKQALEYLAQPVEQDHADYRIEYTVNSSELVESVLHVPDLNLIPPEIHSLASNGKLRTREMPRRLRCDLYRDHVGSCVIHWVLQILSVVPTESVLLHVHAPVVDAATGQTSEQNILSVWVPRRQAEAFDIEADGFSPVSVVSASVHHGEFKRERPSNELIPVVPISASSAQDFAHDSCVRTGVDDLLETISDIREAFINRHLQEDEQGTTATPTTEES